MKKSINNIFLLSVLAKAFGAQAEKDGNCKTLAQAWAVVQEDVMQGANRSRPGSNNGLLEFLVATRNVTSPGFNVGEIMLEKRDGKKSYTVTRKFMPRLAQSEVNDAVDLCGDGGEGLVYKQDCVTIKHETVTSNILIDEEYLRCIRESKQQYQRDVIQQYVRVHCDKFGRQVAKVFETGGYVGKFAKAGGTGCKDLPLLLSDGKSPSPMADVILNEDMIQAELSSMPVLVGGTRLDAFRVLRQIASANLAGFDVSKFGREAVVYRDTNFEATNANRVYAIVPGALKLVTVAYNQGDFALDTPDTALVQRYTLVDPWYGIEHDVYVSVKDCKKEGKEYRMTIITNWELVGYPSCWSDDPDFDGVTDVFCYNAICSDEGACGMDNATNRPGGVPNALETCNSYGTCESNCKALFASECKEWARFSVLDLAGGSYSAIAVNGLNVPLDGIYSPSTQAGAIALNTAITNALAPFGDIRVVGGYWDGSALDLYIITETTVNTLTLRNDAGNDVDLLRTVAYMQHIVDQSTISGNATSYTLAWTPASGTPFVGTPSDVVQEANHYGVMANFFADFAEAGTYTLGITDNTGCTSSYSADLLPCEGQTFDVLLTAFDDANDNDVQNPGELGLQNIKLQIYANLTNVELVDEIITDVNGQALFSLPSGTYNVRVDATFGAAVGRTLSTVLPKYISIAASGAITYGQFTEPALIPIGPVA